MSELYKLAKKEFLRDIITGPDVSHWQGKVDWKEVDLSAATDHRFVYIKATEGEDYTDPTFKRNAIGASCTELDVGPYHFGRISWSKLSSVDKDAIKEAHWFLEQCKTFDPGTFSLRPALDLELGGIGSFYGTSKHDVANLIVDWALYWLTEIEVELGIEPIIYTGYWTWRKMYRSAALFGYRLWQADYTRISRWRGKPSKMENAGDVWEPLIWQHTGKGKCPGVRGAVDLNRFLGTPEQYQELQVSWP